MSDQLREKIARTIAKAKILGTDVTEEQLRATEETDVSSRYLLQSINKLAGERLTLETADAILSLMREEGWRPPLLTDKDVKDLRNVLGEALAAQEPRP